MNEERIPSGVENYPIEIKLYYKKLYGMEDLHLKDKVDVIDTVYNMDKIIRFDDGTQFGKVEKSFKDDKYILVKTRFYIPHGFYGAIDYKLIREEDGRLAIRLFRTKNNSEGFLYAY